MTDKKILGKIETAFYNSKCTVQSITIKWPDRVDKYKEDNPDNRIYEYSPKEILYHYQDSIWYSNSKGKNFLIIKNVCGSIYYYKKYQKLVIVEDDSDPPDNVFIFLIDDLLKSKNIVDMHDTQDRENYHIFSCSDWESNIYHDTQYLYVATEDELVKIDIRTNKITRIH